MRPCTLYPGVRSRYERADVVVIRELTEGSYTGIEFEQGASQTDGADGVHRTHDRQAHPGGLGLSIKAISETASRRIARFAFEHARANGRRKVTAGHKANIMKFSDGLFLEAAREVAREYPDVAFEDRIIDNLAMQLVQRPEDHDVLVLPNLYGDILSDLCAGIVGGLGVAPGREPRATPARSSRRPTAPPRATGVCNRANPMALMLCGAMLLRHIGETDAGDRLEAAVAAVIAEGRTVTYDLRPTRDDPNAATTTQVRDAVIEKLLSR